MERVNLEVGDLFYHVFSENLRSEDIEKWIKIEGDDEVREAIVDDELKKIEAIESETPNTPIVSKDVEMLEGHRSLSKTNVLSHCTQLEDTAFNLKVDEVIYHLRRVGSLLAVAKGKQGRSSSRQLLISEMFSRTSYIKPQ